MAEPVAVDLREKTARQLLTLVRASLVGVLDIRATLDHLCDGLPPQAAREVRAAANDVEHFRNKLDALIDELAGRVPAETLQADPEHTDPRRQERRRRIGRQRCNICRRAIEVEP